MATPARKQAPTLSTYLLSEIEGPLRSELALKTWVLYEMIARRWISAHPIGEVQLPDITSIDLQVWLASVVGGVSARSAVRYASFLRAMLRRASSQGLLSGEPWKGMKDPKVGPVLKRVLSAKDVLSILKLADGRLKRFMVLCAHGLRPSEACGVKGEDIRGGMIHVRRQAQDIYGTVTIVERTKSVQGLRDVPIDSQFRPLFAGISGFVLATRTGTPCSTKELGDQMRELLKDTKYEGVKPYDLRSSFGMMLLESGVDVRTAAEIMGHDPAMLAKVYARSRPELKREAVKGAFGKGRIKVHRSA